MLLIIQALIKAGVHADANMHTSYNETPLYFAIRKHSTKSNYESIIRSLIKAGADVNAKTKREDTPLSLAREKGIERWLRRP